MVDNGCPDETGTSLSAICIRHLADQIEKGPEHVHQIHELPDDCFEQLQIGFETLLQQRLSVSNG